jgi:branched-chain amino acid transport system ATP-binding protein
VGPNGAGKTTLFKAISGVVAPLAGRIRFAGADLLAVAPAARAHLGIAHVPEGRQVFPSLSVLENLEMGAYTSAGRAAWGENLDKIYSWFPVLKQRAHALAGALSGGQQQMLAIARGLASAPKLLMLDEPSMGLAPATADEIFDRIVAIHTSAKLTVLLVEQRVAEALHYADRGYVLETGAVVLSGTHDELQRNDRVRQAYLGM